MIDSQSVKATEAGGPRGHDAGKKIKDRKRHIVADTLGHLVGLLVYRADIQDCDGGADALASIVPYTLGCDMCLPMVAAPAKSSERLAGRGPWTLEIIKRSGHGPRLSGLAAPLGYGANLRMARTLPQAR